MAHKSTLPCALTHTEAMDTDLVPQPPAQIPPVVAPAIAPAVEASLHEMENMEGSMERISSMEVRQALAENPHLFEERFNSLELRPSRNSSGKYQI